MSTEIRFYHVEKSNPENVLPGLIGKALESGHRVLIKLENDAHTDRINDYLWTCTADSFIPHGSKKDPYAAKQPVYLTAENDNPNDADVLILLGRSEMPEAINFKLCCIILDGRNPDSVTAAREQWKKYKNENRSVTYWQQSDKGWEKKSG